MASKRKPAGRPVTMKNGRRVNVYLDDSTVKRAKKIGGGNLSEGIRLAVQNATDTEGRNDE